MQYFTYPVNVSVSNIYESPSQFPAITIYECQKNDFLSLKSLPSAFKTKKQF